MSLLEVGSSLKDIYILIVTGLSGSGKSTVIDALEDIGFFCIDNLPVVLLPAAVDLLSESRWDINRIAVVMDARERSFFSEFEGVFDELKKRGREYRLMFLEARDDVLMRRYKETRRLHPLSDKDPKLGIERERKALQPLKNIADQIIDTSESNPHELRNKIFNLFKDTISKKTMSLMFVSFGYKYGSPSDADIMMDVRFLPNPFFSEELRMLSGLHPDVRSFCLGKNETREFLDKFGDLLTFLIPGYIHEGKSYLTIAIGCTGGLHRSVVIAEELASRLGKSGEYKVSITHRDIEKQKL